MDDRVYQEIRAAIVSGEYLPSERLVEEDLTKRLGVGRAAVRTALVRLEHDGLVSRERNRGAQVRRVSEEEAIEILEARAALEGLAARYAALRAEPAEVDELRALLKELAGAEDAGDLVAESEIKATLQRRILEISRHETARRLSGMLTWQIVRFQYRTVLLARRSVRASEEHATMVEAIAAHDPDRAEAAMRAHLLRVADVLRATDQAGVASAEMASP
jgi:DNA-binding GntR family transcriptional regulator